MTIVKVDVSKDYSKELAIFTDGSALSNSNSAPAGWGVYIPLIKKSLSKGIIGTNNQAELEAIRVALWYFKQYFDKIFKDLLSSVVTRDAIYLISDSEYSMNVISGRYKASKNKDLIASCQTLIQQISDTLHVRVLFMHVNSHTNKQDFLSTNNAIVDTLARTRANEMKSSQK